jgi:general secretion pathway protein G
MKVKQIKSFTLIEVLVVATIIAFLAGASAVSYSEFNKRSRNAKRKADLEQIRLALELFRDEIGRYPLSRFFYDFCLNDNPNPNHGLYVKYLRKPPKDPKCPDYTYSYAPTRSDGSECQNITNPPDYSTWCQDYTLGAYLEGENSTCPISINCGRKSCNYCVGPLGQK